MYGFTDCILHSVHFTTLKERQKKRHIENIQGENICLESDQDTVPKWLRN